MSAKNLFFAFVAWTWVSGFYLDGESFAWSWVIAGAILMLVWTVTSDKKQPILTKMPDGDDDDNDEINFSNMPGYIPPEKRRPVPKNERQQRPRPSPKNL